MQTGEPITAAFAREAAIYLRDGEIGRAVELCVAGTRAYPDYAMGHLVLGKCYEALGHTHEAIAEYRQALNKLPGNPTILALLRTAEERVRKEFQHAIEQQEEREKDTTRDRTVEVPDAERNAAEPPPHEETAFEILARRLEEQRRRRMSQPPPPAEDPPHSAGSLKKQEMNSATNLGIVTPTMAEIYASQGAYAEALWAYRELLARQPQKASYAARIKELEQLAAQAADEKNKAP